MSDWMDIPENPTLAIQFPWDPWPRATCLNCRKRVPGGRYATSHAVDDRGEPGCGIVFKYVSTAAAQPEWIEVVKQMSPRIPR